MKIIYAQQELNIEGKSVFLAGPTPRSEHVQGWREDVVSFFGEREFEGTVMLPEMENGWGTDFEYAEQIEWELEAMERADIILFHIPRKIDGMPGFTTNVEFGYWLAKDKNKIRLSIPKRAEKCDYIRYIALKDKVHVYENWPDMVKDIVRDLGHARIEPYYDLKK